MQTSESVQPIYIERLKCEFALGKGLGTARHSYQYVFKNFGDAPDEDSFYFIVPNATPNEVLNVVVSDDDDHSPSLSKLTHANGTKLIFSNLSSVAQGQSKKLSFSYDAPTSALLYQGFLINVCFYRPELFHTYTVQKAEVIITLPKGSRIIKWVGNATANKTTLTFDEHDLSPRIMHTFPVFFHRRKTLLTLLAAVVPVILTAMFSATVKAAGVALWKSVFGK
jgi:hypothetical protein